MLKNLLFPIALLCLGLPSAFAQKGFHLGVNGNAVTTYLVDTKLYGDVDYKANFTVAPIVGVAAGNNFTNQFGFQVEVNYARLGMGYEYNDSLNQLPGFTKRNGKITLDYIQVPVLLKLTGGDFKTRFSAMAGPQFSFLQNAWNRRQIDSEARPAKNDFNGTEIGLLVFAGSDISLTNDLYLSLGLRMFYGFTQVNKNNKVISPSPLPNSKQLEDRLVNAYGGINVGVHYIFRNNKNPKNQ